MKNTKLKQVINNVVYVEPNYTNSIGNSFGVGGVNAYETAPALEDYCIYVNLEIEVKGRNVQTSKSTNDKTYVLSYVSHIDGDSSINFMQGSKIPIGDKGGFMNSLTTNYTDIHLTDLKGKDPTIEMFGIKSIDIAYRNYTVPEVTIDFIDVRGVSLFAQKELHETYKNTDKSINEDASPNIANTFFQCFFTFPYPKFTLLVKGFYGQPVSYELTCSDFRARFDSNTGNFACTAKFVGYQFSFLNDVMLNGLIAAPYSDYIGAEYWQDKEFKIVGKSGGLVNAPKIGWLLRQMKKIEDEANKMSQSDPSVQEKEQLDQKTASYKKVEDAYNIYVDLLASLVSNKTYEDEKIYYQSNGKNGYAKGIVVLTPNDNNEPFNMYFNDFDNSKSAGYYETLEYTINEYNSEHPDEQLPMVEPFHESIPSKRIWNQPNSETKACSTESGNDDIKEKNLQLYNDFKIGVNNGNLKEKNPLLDYTSVYFFHDNGFSSKLEEYKENVSEKTREVEERIETLKDDIISDILEFRPTVENLTKIMMAHFETFVRMIYETSKTICNQNPPRTIKSLGVSDAYDLPDLDNKSKSLECIVPPFPKVVTEVKRNNTTVREETWIDDYTGDFRERDLINGLINGVKEVSKDIQSYEANETFDASGSEGINVSMSRFPLSPLDLIAKSNPYVPGGFDENDPSSLLGLVALRGIQILSTTNFNGWGDKSNVLGKAEAYNLLAKNRLSNEMIKKLTPIYEDNVIKMLTGDDSGDIKKPGDGTKPWPWRLKPDEGGMISADNGDLDICRVNGNDFSLPYQSLSWESIKNDTLNSPNGAKAKASEDYINSNCYSDIDKGNIFTFDTNVNRFSSIIEEQMKGIDGIEYYKDKMLKECKYTSDGYSSYFKKDYAPRVISYIIENAASIIPTDGSCMLPTSKNAFSDKSFGGGYNLDYFSKADPGEGGSGQLWWKDKWKDKDGNEVKRKGDNGYKKYLEELNSRDFTFTEFCGVRPNLEPYIETVGSDPETSIFGQYLYYRQKDDRSKALLFLASLGYAIDYRKVISDFMAKSDVTMSIIPLPAVMFSGALLWANKNESLLKDFNTSGYESSLELLNTLRDDVKRRLIKIFENWVSSGVEGDRLLKSFADIKSGMELSFVKNGITYDDFFTKIGEIEDKKVLFIIGGNDWIKQFGDYKNIMEFLAGELSDSFFRNYIAIDEDTNGSTSDYTRGIRLGNRDGGPSSLAACNFALAGCVFSKNSKFFHDKNTNISVDIGNLKSFFNGFLEIIHQEKVEEDENGNYIKISQAKEPDDSNDDIKIGIYRYCKMIYDRWIAGLSDKEFEENWTYHSFFESDNKYFHFIDAYYNESGDIPLDIGDFCDKIVSSYRSTQYSLLSFLSDMYAKNKFIFQCVQNFMDLSKIQNMETMFDNIPWTSYWNVNKHPNFIVMYAYEASVYLADINNNEYSNDGFMLNQRQSTENIWPEPLKAHNMDNLSKYIIPAFGVSYGHMYQSFFKDIDVSMDSPIVTEQSIKAQFAIACQNNEGEQTGDRSKMYTYGQDLYSIYSNNSYTCNVTMMGCAWVQPLMYFVLNNVPMFRGTYLIQKVSHHIEQGNMVTKFTGVRMANVCTRIVRKDSVRAKNNQTGNGETNGERPEIEERLASVDNDCPYKEYPLTSDGGDFELTGNLNSDASKMMKMIMARGYSKVQAAGIVGNIAYESNFDAYKIICDSNRDGSVKSLSGGLCMWNSNSLNALLHKDPSHAFASENSGGYGKLPCGQYSINDIKKQLPSASEQLAFMLDTLEKDQYIVKKMGVKQKLLAETTTDGAAFTFGRWYENCGDCKYENSDSMIERKKNARQFFNSYREEPNNIEIAGNQDGHVSELATNFLNALNKTAEASSNNVSIGVDQSKSSGDTLYLTGKGDGFASVMDMIINTYPDKVSDITWIIPNGGDQTSVPAGYLVKVKEGSSLTNIKVANESNPNSPIEVIHVSKGDDNSGIHKSFCKALVKKYKSNTNELKSDTNNKLDDYDALFNDDKYKLQHCNELINSMYMGENGAYSNEYGTGGSIDDEGYIGGWNVNRYVNRLHYWRDHICKGGPKTGGCSSCTGVINRALEDSGLNKKYWDNYPWQVYDKMKKGNDFTEIRSAGPVKSNVEFSLGEVQKGDICVMWRPGRNPSQKYFHTCSYDGSKWISDFTQYACNPYRRYPVVDMEWHLFRHV